MITVHASTITAVPTNNGLGALAPTACPVMQEINGEYELELTHPKDEYGKWERLVNDNILYVPTPDGAQLFRIYRVRKNILGEIVANARHIFYDLLGNIIETLALTADTGEEAIDAILGATQYATTFTGLSDIATTQNASYALVNPVQALISDDDNSFLNKWGGEIQRDNFSIAINSSIGADNGRVVSYKKNMTGVDAQTDYTNVVTRIMPTGLNEDDTVLYLAAKYVDSAHIADYPHPRIKHVHFADIKVGKVVDGVVLYADIAAARTELTARANALLALNCDQPEVSIDVEFAELGDTEEYQQYINLSTVQLGDTIHIVYDLIDTDLRVVSYKWDALRGRHDQIRLGAKRPNIGKSVVDIDIDISILKNDYTGVVKQNEKYNEVYINHTEGFVSEATVDGIVMKVRANGTDGFELLADGVVVGGFKVVNGKARLVTDTFGEIDNVDKIYVSMEPDPDSLADGVMSFWRYDSSDSSWYEFARFFTYQNTFYINAFPDSTSPAAGMRLYAKGDGTGYSMARLFGGTSGTAPYAYLYTSRGVNNVELRLTDTALTITKNGVVVATW